MTGEERTVQIAGARTIVQALAQQVIDLMDDGAVTERVQSDLAEVERVLTPEPTQVAPSVEQIASVISDALVYDTTTDSDVIDADLAANRVHALLSQLTDPTVQVPVSLPTREQVEAALLSATSTESTVGFVRVDRARDAVLALLSPPTPTAKPTHYDDPPSCSPCRTGRHDACSGLPFPRRQCQCKDEWHTEPPRIEDMAPGTTFTADGIRGPERMMRTNGDVVVAVGTSGHHYYIGDVDRSSVRDVAPPKGDDRG
jgi:hypothetical protein